MQLGQLFGDAASRAPSTSAMSARLLARRGPVSKKMSVAGTSFSSWSRARRGPDFGGRKPAKRKVSVGSPALVRRASDGRRSRDADDRDASVERFAHELVAGVGDERRARVRDQRDRLSGAEPRHKPRAFALGIVLVIGAERAADAEMGEQLLRVPRVLGGDEIGAGEHGERPERNVGEIADRRRHEIKPGLQAAASRRSRERLAARAMRPGREPAHPFLVLLVLHAHAEVPATDSLA